MMVRRDFLKLMGATGLSSLFSQQYGQAEPERSRYKLNHQASPAATVRLFLCGDVMTGRGIDQILAHPVDPKLHESWVTDAREYVLLAEQANGPITKPVDDTYIWGEALEELERMAPDLRIINLETAITSHEHAWPKGINYRMHPENASCIKAASPDCCVLANNHVLDWGRPGLEQTLATLARFGLGHAGAGRNLGQASQPLVLPVPGKARVLVFGFGSVSSGIDSDWAAASNRSGVNLLPNLSHRTVESIARQVQAVKREGDIALASIHWGGNWGYPIPKQHRTFARALIDRADIDLIHGHSSHHVKGIEVYRNRLIIYGCGDFLNDYEGIRAHEAYRDDLGLMYFPTLEAGSGKLLELLMIPTRIRRFRVNQASDEETRELFDLLNREGESMATGVTLREDGRLSLQWHAGE